MNVKGAVVYRIQAICAKQELTVNALANYCGIAPTPGPGHSVKERASPSTEKMLGYV